MPLPTGLGRAPCLGWSLDDVGPGQEGQAGAGGIILNCPGQVVMTQSLSRRPWVAGTHRKHAFETGSKEARSGVGWRLRIPGRSCRDPPGFVVIAREGGRRACPARSPHQTQDLEVPDRIPWRIDRHQPHPFQKSPPSDLLVVQPHGMPTSRSLDDLFAHRSHQLSHGNRPLQNSRRNSSRTHLIRRRGRAEPNAVGSLPISWAWSPSLMPSRHRRSLSEHPRQVGTVPTSLVQHVVTIGERPGGAQNADGGESFLRPVNRHDGSRVGSRQRSANGISGAKRPDFSPVEWRIGRWTPSSSWQ